MKTTKLNRIARSLSILALAFPLGVLATSPEDTRRAIYENLPSCDRAVFTNDQYFAAGLASSNSDVGTVRVVSLADPKMSVELPASGRIVDLKIKGDILYVLTGTRLEAWRISSQKRIFAYPTHPQVGPDSNPNEFATGFILRDDRAVISHGASGLTIVNLGLGETAGKIEKVISLPTLWSAQDIDFVDSDRAVVAIDNEDDREFRGMGLLDLKSLSIIRRMKVGNAFPLSVRVLDRDRLMLVYLSAIWKFDLSSALASSKPKPSRRVSSFSGMSAVDIVGKVAFDRKNLYGCFKLWNPQTGDRAQKPMAFDLESLHLDGSK